MSITKDYLTLAEFAFHHVVKKSICVTLTLVSLLWIVLPATWMQNYFTVWAYICILGAIITGGHFLYVAHPVDNPPSTGRRIALLMFLSGATGTLWAEKSELGLMTCLVATLVTFIVGLLVCFTFVSKEGVAEQGSWEVRLFFIGLIFALLQVPVFFFLRHVLVGWELLPRIGVILFALLTWFAWTPFFEKMLSILPVRNPNVVA